MTLRGIEKVKIDAAQKPKRPATPRARKLRTVLGALAVCGVNGERTNAAAKLARLLKKYDFDARDNSEARLFDGQFYPDCTARRVWTFDPSQMDWAANVKWAIETGCKVACVLRGSDLLAEATPTTADRLCEITARITTGFGRLWEIFRAAPGANPSDRQTFLLGLYDGMMDEHRPEGARLPARAAIARTAMAKRNALAAAPGFCVHPYTVAADLGRQLRFSVPLPEIEAELSNKLYPQLKQP